MKKEKGKTQIIYEYRISSESMDIVKNVYTANVEERNNGKCIYIIFRGKYKDKKLVSSSALGVVERNIVFSLEDDFDKYAKKIMEAYKERSDVLEQQLNDRKMIFENLMNKYDYFK